jgi:hypothetical protein
MLPRMPDRQPTADPASVPDSDLGGSDLRARANGPLPDRISTVLIVGGQRTITVEAASYDAILDCVRRCEVAGLGPLRLCAGDWVTLQDVADRIGRSREAVRLWSIGRNAPGGFPPPLNPGSKTEFYSWAEVAPWLRHKGLDIPHVEPILAAMNLALQLRHLVPQLAQVEHVFSCLLGR